MADIDDLLDDIEIEADPATAIVEEEINLEDALLSPEFKQWNSAVSELPPDIKNKWSMFAVKDSKIKLSTRLQASQTFRSWDGQPPTVQTSTKVLLDAVRTACSKCGFDDKKTTSLLALSNPLEVGPGKEIGKAYSKQILRDLRRVYTADPDFEESKFPHLFAFAKE